MSSKVQEVIMIVNMCIGEVVRSKNVFKLQVVWF